MKPSPSSDREQLKWSGGDVSHELAAIPSPPRRVRRYRGYFALVGRWVIAVPFVMFLVIYLQIAVGTIRLNPITARHRIPSHSSVIVW